MVLTPSTMLELGTRAPRLHAARHLREPVALAEFAGAPATVIVFMCNHCPYVKHLKTALAEFAHEYATREVAVIGINSNDAETHPEDGREAMVPRHRRVRLRLSLPDRRQPGGRQGVLRGVHPPTSTSSTRGVAPGLPGAVRRQPARERRPRDRPRACARRSTPSSPARRQPVSRSRASAATSSGSRATSPTTSGRSLRRRTA